MNDKDKQDLEITEQFIREYCTRTELETKARDAAFLLLKQLEECRNPPCQCEEAPKEEQKPEKKEENKQEEEPKKEEEVVAEKKEEPVISDEKFQELQNAKQGKKPYKEYLKKQLKTIGLAGIIAMSTAVYAQSQVVYKNGMIVYEVLEKEFPILTTIKNLITKSTPSDTSQNGSSSSSGSSDSSTASTSQSVPSNSSSTSPTSTNTSDASTLSVNQSQQPIQDVKQTASKDDTTDKEDVLGGDKPPGVIDLDNQFGQPIAPPKTTETNPR
jgi:hypothetical protein